MKKMFGNKYVHFVAIFIIGISLGFVLLNSKKKAKEITEKPHQVAKKDSFYLSTPAVDSLMTILLADTSSKFRKHLDSLINQKYGKKNISSKKTKK